MDVIACVLVALAHSCFANAVFLEKPISLAVLRGDLQELETTFPSGELWQDSKIIKYDDKLKFLVSGHETRDIGKLFLEVNGTLIVAESKDSDEGSPVLSSQQKIQLFFQNGYFYFDNPTFQPVVRPEDTYIVGFDPPPTYSDKKPVIEYIPGDRMVEYLKETIPSIRYESRLSGAKIVKTYFRLKNGVRVNIWYDRSTDVAVLKDTFHVVFLTDKQDLIRTCEQVHALSYYLYRPSSIQLSAVGAVHSVRVTPSLPQSSGSSLTGSVKIKRKQVLKDMLDSSPTLKLSLSNVVGVIVYDSSKVCTIKYIQTNHRTLVRLAGTFRTNDGVLFYWLCLATTVGMMDKKDVNEFRGSNRFSEQPVLFPCEDTYTETAHIVLREDDDFIEMMNSSPAALDNLNELTKREPFLEYIHYEHFLQTLKIVSDVLKKKCANDRRHPYRSFKLFVDISLVYDCKSGILWFDILNLWIGCYERASLLCERVSSVSYDSNINEFIYDVGIIRNFKIRQLHSVMSRNFPIDAQYKIDCGMVNVGIDLRSVEWDLYNIRKTLMNRLFGIGPTVGVIYVDDKRLLVAHMTEDKIGGEKKKIVKVNGLGLFSNCIEHACVESKEIIHDGTNMLMRNSSESELREVSANIFWPSTACESSLLDDAIVDFFDKQERYVKLSTFQKDMKELAWLLRRECSEHGNEREHSETLIFHMYYFRSKEPAIGKYQCALQYIYFSSDFKVIKHPNVERDFPSQGSGKASEVAQGGFQALQAQYYDDVKLLESIQRVRSKEGELRRKYSDYILQDLVYDHRGKNLHSGSMFLYDVYALRLLPPIHAEETPKRGNPIELKLDSGCKVEVYTQNVT